MDIEIKEIYKYKTKDQKNMIKVFERTDGILLIKSQGTLYRQCCEDAINFLLDYSEMSDIKNKILADNTELEDIDDGAKICFLRLRNKNYSIKKIASFGDNIIIKSFAKMFKNAFKFHFKHYSFDAKKEAICWLKGD